MILLRTAFMDFRKNLFMNFITILEMTATIIILIIMVSSILIRYEYYVPFKDFFKSNGLYCEFSSIANKNMINGSPLTDYVHNDEIFEFLNSPNEIVACNTVMGTVITTNNTTLQSNNYCYNDEIIRRFSHKIKEGRWFNMSTTAKNIEVVISKNDYGWKVGDKLIFLFYNFPESITVEIEVVGILQDSSKNSRWVPSTH